MKPVPDAPAGIDAPASRDSTVTGANLAFVTSTMVAPGALGSLDGADAMCGQLATAAGHPGTFVAWLSSRTMDAKARLPASALGWQRTDGKPVAATLDQLIDVNDAQLWYPLRLDENGNDLGAVTTFTGTTRLGTTAGGDCGGYASTTSTDVVNEGESDSTWRWADSSGYESCDTPAHFYCFQVDGTVAVTAPVLPAGAKRVFVSAMPFVPGSAGLAGADAACGGGSTVAWLATTTTSANQRITGTGPWYRTDGVEVAGAGAWTGTFEAPVDLDPTGTRAAHGITWTGADTPTALGTTLTCSDWTSTTLNGEMASTVDQSIDPFGDTPVHSGCATTSIAVYCVDN